MDKLPVDVFVEIVGTPFLERAVAYKAEFIRVHTAWREYGLAKGADKYLGYRRLTGLAMSGRQVPAGFTKPNSKGWTYPKKQTVEWNEMVALPTLPSTRDIFGDAVIDAMSYEMPSGGHGSGGISNKFDIWLGWAGERYFALIPHARNAAMNHLEHNPDHTIRGDLLGWNVPLGLAEISKARIDLVFAQHRVDEEAAEAAVPE